MRYSLSVEIKLVEMPEPPSETEAIEGADPMAALGKMATGLLTSIRPGEVYHMPRMPAGMDFRTTVAVSAPGVEGLCKIINRFDALCSQLQLEQP